MKPKCMKRTLHSIHRLNNRNRQQQPGHHRNKWEPPAKALERPHDHTEEHIGQLIVSQ